MRLKFRAMNKRNSQQNNGIASVPLMMEQMPLAVDNSQVQAIILSLEQKMTLFVSRLVKVESKYVSVEQ